MIGSYPGLWEGLQIHRNYPPEEWRVQVDFLPVYLREGAERYLSGIVALDASLKTMARQCGCRSMEEFQKLRKEARYHGAPGARAWVKAGKPEKWRRGGDDW